MSPIWDSSSEVSHPEGMSAASVHATLEGLMGVDRWAAAVQSSMFLVMRLSKSCSAGAKSVWVSP